MERGARWLFVILMMFLLPVGGAFAADKSADGDQPATAVKMTPDLSDALGALEVQARDHWPQEFAGLWIDEDDNDVLHSVSIAFTEEANEKVAQLKTDFPDSSLVSPVQFGESYKLLESREIEMVRDRDAIKNGELQFSGDNSGNYDLDIDITRNTLVVTVPKLSDAIDSAFKSRYGQDVIVKEGPLYNFKACNSRTDCSPDLRAGLKVDNVLLDSCTSGFTVHSSTGNTNVLSAGHCSGSTRYHNGYYIGDIKGEQTNSRVDAERFLVDPGFSFSAIPSIYVDSTYKNIAVETRSTWDGLTVGSNACKSGAFSGESCGGITSKSGAPNNVPNANRFILVGVCTQAGDSGSPLFDSSNWHKAHGILSSSTLSSGASCPNSNVSSAFGHIEYALNALGITLVVSP